MENAFTPEQFKGTPLEDMLEILKNVLKIQKSGNFVAAPSQKIDENETGIGELTALEKALWSAAKKAESEFLTIATEHNTMLDNLNGEKPDEDVVTKNLKAAATKKCEMNTLSKFLWTTIRRRLEKLISEDNQITIRENYQIVITADECTGCPLRW